MDHLSTVQTLFNYHWHTTRRLLEKAVLLDDKNYRHNPGYGRGSIHDLLFHLLVTNWMWRQGLETGRQPAPLSADDYPDLAALRAGLEAEQQAWDSYLAGLTPADLATELALTTRRGGQFPIVRWRVLHHLVLHGMQHHAELAQLLTSFDQSPGDIDFIFFNG